MKRPKEKQYHNQMDHNYGSIIGIILIVLGVIFLYIRFSLSFKISASLIFIGFVIILMINEKEANQTINNIQLILIIMILTLVAWILTINSEIEIFFISIIIGIIALKELLDTFLSQNLNKRMNLLCYILLSIFIIIVILSFPRIGYH